LAINHPKVYNKKSFWRKPLLNAFSKMSKGRLDLVLPEKQIVSYGDTNQNHVARIEINSENFFKRCILYGDIGFAESFLDKEWETDDIASVIAWFIINLENAPGLSGSKAPKNRALNILRYVNRVGHIFSKNSKDQAKRNIAVHYDLSNEFFSLFLDSSMMYSSAKWSEPNLSLEAAQFEKNEALCRSLELKPTDHVLEIGSGWGGWALHAARRYGCKVTSITLSKEQLKLAKNKALDAKLDHLVEFELRDYRDLNKHFDKLVSIEMMEAIGHEYLPQFCSVINNALKSNGIAALQFITCPDNHYEEMRRGVDFIQKHIFPGSLLLSLGRFNSLMHKSGSFVLSGIDDLGLDYAKTLKLWHERFNAHLPSVNAMGFDEYFIRKWKYYLAYCEAAFQYKKISVVQAVYKRSTALA
jgi:cyclopropane-fatty-acyl-phospholipid synthase